MPLPNGGQIDMNQIQTEFGGVPQIGLNEYYKGGPYVSYSDNAPNVPTSGQIALSNFWGAAKVNVDITQSGLQLWYDLGRTSSYPGSGSTVFDISGNGRNGTLNNGAYWQYAYNGVSQNGNKSSIIFDGVDDFLNTNTRFLSGWPSGCWTGRGPYTVCMWIRPYVENVAQNVYGTVNEGIRDILSFSVNRHPGRDDSGYRSFQMYVRDGVDDGDYGYSVKYVLFNNPYSTAPCYIVYPFDSWGAHFTGYHSFVCWRVLDNYYSSAYNYNYVRVYKFPTVGSVCGVSSGFYNEYVVNHDWPFTFNCFEHNLYFGCLNRRGTPFRFFTGAIAQIQIYNRALADYEMDYNFDQHRNRYE